MKNLSVTFRYLIGRLLGEGVICSSTIETCTELPIVAERTAEAVSYQYYRFAEDELPKFVDTFLDGICLSNPLTSPLYHSCWGSLRELAGASTLDVDYTSNGDVLTLKALWGRGEIKGGAGPHGFHSELAEGDRLEVGVLESQRGKSTGELSLGGYLTVVGEDDRPSESAAACSPTATNELRTNILLICITTSRITECMRCYFHDILSTAHRPPSQTTNEAISPGARSAKRYV